MQKTSTEGPFFFLCAKAGLHETLVIVSSDNSQEKRKSAKIYDFGSVCPF